MKIATGQRVGVTNLRDSLRISKFEGNYNTQDSLEYANFMRKMNLAELQEHAVKVGIVPSTDRKKLETVLAKEFETNKRNYRVALSTKGVKKVLTPEQVEKLKNIEHNFLKR